MLGCVHGFVCFSRSGQVMYFPVFDLTLSFLYQSETFYLDRLKYLLITQT